MHLRSQSGICRSRASKDNRLLGNVGSRRGLVRWIRDFERNPRSPHLPDLVKLVHRTWRSLVDPAEGVLVRGFVRCQGIAFEVGYIGFTPKFLLVDMYRS
uniref:Uncharacterized protein n=1 Tax=Ananas comosus var. bracteatus TaxID=296719 RepID=A0A6V7NJD9_ANACO|nr:unnamed protein product [Ananas comosus var. bracteatus]